MKKRVCLFLVGVVLFTLMGCSAQSAASGSVGNGGHSMPAQAASMTKPVSIDGLSFNVAQNWRTENHTNLDDGKNELIIYPNSETVFSAAVYDGDTIATKKKQFDGGKEKEVSTWSAEGVEFTRYDDSDKASSDYFTRVVGVSENGTGFLLTLRRGDTGESSFVGDETVQAMLDTISFDNASAASSVSVVQPSGQSISAPSNPTVSQTNAVRMAKQYLSTMPFSHDGLVAQLEYEGFSHEDSAYGADNCGADWNVQAVKMAKQYLKTMPFSRDGLIEQLVYEGFTAEQAEYGVNSAGL